MRIAGVNFFARNGGNVERSRNGLDFLILSGVDAF